MPVLPRSVTKPAGCRPGGLLFLAKKQREVILSAGRQDVCAQLAVSALTDATSKSDSGISGIAGLCCVEPAVFV